MPNGDQIQRVEFAVLEGTRPRSAGSNARLGDHGKTISMPMVRLTTADGAVGFGRTRADETAARTLLGKSIADLVSPDGVTPEFQWAEFALFDLAARREDVPVYRYLAPETKDLAVLCYDTTLYFDDLEIADDAEAVALIADEAREGLGRGHRHFKIKIGRGARHMPLEQGTARDIAIIHAVREVAGPDAMVMVDANNGYNLNLTKRVIEETADANLYWMEEAFHEDAVLYQDLQGWLTDNQFNVLVADGEGSADPALPQWARDGLVDVLQYDVFGYGFTKWLTLGAELDAQGIGSAPHNYGSGFGNWAAGHLASRIEGFVTAEVDPADFAEIDASAYVIQEGTLSIPDLPGFGLTLDEALWNQAVKAAGFTVSNGASGGSAGGRGFQTA